MNAIIRLNTKPKREAQTQDEKDAFELHPPSYYNYRLAGILVHTGTANGGHYYSYIQDSSEQRDTWLEFNDNSISSLSFEDAMKNCFGGVNHGSSTKVKAKRTNANLIPEEWITD